ncbi:MAG: hypothetical protein RIB60_06850 [Phycisphaerales bacterium]
MKFDAIRAVVVFVCVAFSGSATWASQDTFASANEQFVSCQRLALRLGLIGQAVAQTTQLNDWVHDAALRESSTKEELMASVELDALYNSYFYSHQSVVNSLPAEVRENLLGFAQFNRLRADAARSWVEGGCEEDSLGKQVRLFSDMREHHRSKMIEGALLYVAVPGNFGVIPSDGDPETLMAIKWLAEDFDLVMLVNAQRVAQERAFGSSESRADALWGLLQGINLIPSARCGSVVREDLAGYSMALLSVLIELNDPTIASDEKWPASVMQPTYCDFVIATNRLHRVLAPFRPMASLDRDLFMDTDPSLRQAGTYGDGRLSDADSSE